MKVEHMNKEEIEEFINARIRKSVILKLILDDDNALDRVSTDAIASLFDNCIVCYHCPLTRHCQTESNCYDNVLTYLTKGVKGFNEHTTKQL